jgi:hypothetical protein
MQYIGTDYAIKRTPVTAVKVIKDVLSVILSPEAFQVYFIWIAFFYGIFVGLTY